MTGPLFLLVPGFQRQSYAATREIDGLPDNNYIVVKITPRTLGKTLGAGAIPLADGAIETIMSSSIVPSTRPALSEEDMVLIRCEYASAGSPIRGSRNSFGTSHEKIKVTK